MTPLEELIEFITTFVATHPGATKDVVTKATATKFCLREERSVFDGPNFAVRFSTASGKSFSNVVLSLSALLQYDRKPFIICVVRPSGVELLLANTTFLKKISHSSQQLRLDNIKGSFLGHDILREHNGLPNTPENFATLFALHQAISWAENLARLVEATNNIVPTGVRFSPTTAEREAILKSVELARSLSADPAYKGIFEELRQLVVRNTYEILAAAQIDNINIRGNNIEQIVTETGNFHRLDDLCFDLAGGIKVHVDIKTKVLTLKSNPKGYNVDKVLQVLADGKSVFAFFFIGIEPGRGAVSTQLVSILDARIISATRVQFHWAGRNSRGVTQLCGDDLGLFEPDFEERIEPDQAREFLEYLLSLEGVPS